MSWKTLFFTVPLALLALGPTASATGHDGDAEYVGFRGFDHGLGDEWDPLCQQFMPRCTSIPDASMMWDCSSPQPEVQWGGVLFCDIPVRSRVSLLIEDDAVDEPWATVVCLSEHPGGNDRYEPVTRIQGHGVVPLPDWCKPTPAPGPATVQLGVVLEAPPEGLATHGRVYHSLV